MTERNVNPLGLLMPPAIFNIVKMTAVLCPGLQDPNETVLVSSQLSRVCLCLLA